VHAILPIGQPQPLFVLLADLWQHVSFEDKFILSAAG
jgi:hypothetical protein